MGPTLPRGSDTISYITYDDLRSATALYPYLTVPSSGNGSVSNSRLTSMITAASQAIDTFCRDHFEATASTTFRIQGDGSYYLTLPRRIRAVTSVAVVDYAGTSTSVSSSYYRIHTSLNSISGSNIIQGGEDQLELIQDLTVGNAAGRWPYPPWKIEVTGDWDWASVPEAVKEAACYIVWSKCQSYLPPNVEEAQLGGIRVRRPPLDVESTGVFEADRILISAGLRRLAFSGRASVVA